MHNEKKRMRIYSNSLKGNNDKRIPSIIKNRKLTIEEMKKIVEDLGGHCLSDTYKNHSFPPNRCILDELETDGYNDQIKLGFEYNGAQHYDYISTM